MFKRRYSRDLCLLYIFRRVNTSERAYKKMMGEGLNGFLPNE